MLKIRLQRVGRKHEPLFRLVLTDSHNSTKSGKLLQVLGSYDARRGEKAEIDSVKVKHWMSKGAKVSDTVHNMLVSRKIIEGKKINVLPKKSAIKSEVQIEPQVEPKAEAPSEVVAEAIPESVAEMPAEEKVEDKVETTEETPTE